MKERSRPLTLLGKAMERQRAKSNMSVSVYCAARGIVRTTWDRLAYDHTAKPRRDTVIKVAAAADIDIELALTLAGHAPHGPSARSGETRGAMQQLTPLGKAMERLRLATGQNVAVFCKARGIVRTTWYRLAYDHDSIPTEAVVDQLAGAIGLDRETALALRQEGISQIGGDKHPLTPLGEAMEEARIKAEMDVRTFCATHGIERKTWHRVAYGLGKPWNTTVTQIAAAIGMSPELARLLAGLDPDLPAPSAEPAGETVRQSGDNGDSTTWPGQ